MPPRGNHRQYVHADKRLLFGRVRQTLDRDRAWQGLLHDESAFGRVRDDGFYQTQDRSNQIVRGAASAMTSPRHLALGIFMLNRFSAFTLPLLMLFSCALMPQSQSQQATVSRAAPEQNEAAKSEQQLRELLRNNPEAFARNNYDYLLARLLETRDAQAEG